MIAKIARVAGVAALLLTASLAARAQDNAPNDTDAAQASPDTLQAMAGSSDYAQIARGCRRRLAAGAGYPPSASTPVTVRVIQPIVPVPATDGFIHLAYAAEVTNLSRSTATITAFTPVDPLAGFQPTGTNSVVDGDGNAITGKVRLFNPNLLDLIDGPHPEKATDFTQMPGGSAGTTFFDVRYQRAADLPRLIAQQITIQMSDQPTPISAASDPLVVSCDPPPVLRPPLVGSNWWNGNGCCEIVGPHRGATLPINGEIHAPESFAIDYVQLTADNGCCSGPNIHDLASWPFFGAPILAVADGTVVEMENDMPEQIPAQDPVGITVANAAGNHIIESIQGGRYFVLYAHLKTGSIPPRLKVGSRLRAGEQIGALGNSGSSTAPHLHFQVMDRPSALDAAGLPFVFTSQQLQGTVVGTLNAAATAYEAGKPVTVDRSATSWQAFRMPAETQVFGYNLR